MKKNITKETIARALLDTAFFRSADATSLSDIAEVVDIKKASLYNHFPSRDDMMAYTFRYCADYFSRLTFIPADVDGVAKKYPTGTVLKGIVNRYFKMHEKYPLFQMYTFVESQKYFAQEARDIIAARDEKLISQVSCVMEALSACGKMAVGGGPVRPAAILFCRAVGDLLNAHLQEHKRIVLQNPATGEGELFSLPVDNSSLERLDALVDFFVTFVQ